MRIGYDREQSDNYREKYGVIILAAGLSSRMKAFKPLLPVAGSTAIEGLIDSAKAAGLDDITVVIGYNRELLEPLLKTAGVREAYNPDYESGMFSSIKCGLMAASVREKNVADADGDTELCTGKEGYLLMPVDCPLISVRVMRMVMGAKVDDAAAGDTGCTSHDTGCRASEAGNATDARFRVATFEGKKGHPLLVPASFIDEICEYEGEGGLAGITDKHAICRIETGEEGCVLDMDTREGYEDIRGFASRGYCREKLELLTARKRIFLVRHGDTQQHDEPMFIGQYDVQLNDAGRRQAASIADGIVTAMREDVEAEALGMDKFGKEPMPAIERIYCSDLSRAIETAEIICKKVNEILPEPVSVKALSGLREINLGPWDGKSIREIKEKYPSEYKRRGQNIMTFKIRGKSEVEGAVGGSENFYDMQYRVLRAFREILRFDDAKDIIIVAHSGVCRVLEQNINGSHVDDEWEPMAKGSFRMFEPFPEQPYEKAGKAGEQDRPMSSDSLTMESVLEYYD